MKWDDFESEIMADVRAFDAKAKTDAQVAQQAK